MMTYIVAIKPSRYVFKPIFSNFSHYVNRFSMPGGSGDGMFYSFNVGPVHFVSFSSEYYYYIYYGWKQIVRQYEWLEKDLQVWAIYMGYGLVITSFITRVM